jgi:signal transduction histidine kinase
MLTDNKEKQLQNDVASIQKIPIIATLLDVVCRTTGMGFAAIARVTEDRWITCTLLDKIEFGLKPGDELKVETTLCHEVRQNAQEVIIDHVDKDEYFSKHHTPLQYGFQSYISVPIKRRDGSFFGTLCAIDPKPAKLNKPEIKGMFNLFADLISFHLNAVEQLEVSEDNLLKEREERTKMLEQKNLELQRINIELESFAYIASHDLQEPLRKIETFSNFILDKDFENLSNIGQQYFQRMLKSVKRMQTLIRDLIRYTQVKVHEQVFENTPLCEIVEEVKQSYNEELQQKKAVIEMHEMCNAFIIPFQFNQLLQNLIGNSVKFTKAGEQTVIQISSVIKKGLQLNEKSLLPEKRYCHITIADNGIGFDPLHKDKIFEVFQRLNGREEYDGTGIGLSIVKKIVDNHKGLITANGELNKGARFDIYLPQP